MLHPKSPGYARYEEKVGEPRSFDRGASYAKTQLLGRH